MPFGIGVRTSRDTGVGFGPFLSIIAIFLYLVVCLFRIVFLLVAGVILIVAGIFVWIWGSVENHIKKKKSESSDDTQKTYVWRRY